jgi:hypothetical protein
MFGLDSVLVHEEDDEAGWHKGHSHNDKDSYKHIGTLGPTTAAASANQHPGRNTY